MSIMCYTHNVNQLSFCEKCYQTGDLDYPPLVQTDNAFSCKSNVLEFLVTSWWEFVLPMSTDGENFTHKARNLTLLRKVKLIVNT